MSRITTRRFALWWSLAQTWLNNKFSGITIDTSTLATKTAQTAQTAQLTTIKAEADKIGTAPVGASYSTLFGAIAAAIQAAGQGGGGGGSIPSEQMALIAKQGTDADATLSLVQTKLQQIIDANILTPVLGETTWVQGHTPTTAQDIIVGFKQYLVSLKSNMNVTPRNYMFSYCQALTEIELGVSSTIGYMFSDCPNLQKVSLPAVTSMGNYTFQNCNYLRYLNAIKCTNFTLPPNADLIDIVAGDVSVSFSLASWTPTNALLDNVSTLVPAEVLVEHPDWKNKDYLLYNIRRHIAANLPTRTAATSLNITMSAAVKAAIQADTETSNAFSDKYWNVI